MTVSWSEGFERAQAALKEARFFDGVQAINSCMETYAKVIGDDSDRVLRDPSAFLQEYKENLKQEQKDVLRKMYEVRGDIITGLGAHKRAMLDYQSAQLLGAILKDKLAKTEAAAKAAKEKTVSDAKVPVTVLTGFLGSGKTTLLNHILHEFHGKRIAIIENEFGEVGIDDSLIEAGPLAMEENVIEMNNGCICCTVRGDLIAGLKKIMKLVGGLEPWNFIFPYIGNNHPNWLSYFSEGLKPPTRKISVQSGKPLDGVIIETTGLADPAPVAQTFFADDFVQQNMQLDGIVTLVDAKHLIMHLDEEKPEGVENEAVEQVA